MTPNITSEGLPLTPSASSGFLPKLALPFIVDKKYDGTRQCIMAILRLQALLVLFICLSLAGLAVAVWWSHPQCSGGSCLNGQTEVLPTSQCSGQLDVVYSWVNGSDPAWLQLYSNHSTTHPHVENDTHAAGDHRFADCNCLQYSLRSVRENLPWARHVYLVTADQVPSWLNDSHPDVTVVSHSEIIPRRYLPLFNSNAIELWLHKIAGISDCFLYFNDDFFPVRSLVRQNFVLDSGQMLYFPEDVWGLTPGMFTLATWSQGFGGPMTVARQRASDLLDARFGERKRFYLQHSAYTVSVKIMEEIHRDYPHEIDRTSRNRFRSDTDFVGIPFFAPYFAIDSERGLLDPSFHSCFTFLTDSKWINGLLLFLMDLVQPQFMAVNDYRTEFTPDVIEQFRGNLEKRWPKPTDFERSDDPTAAPETTTAPEHSELAGRGDPAVSNTSESVPGMPRVGGSGFRIPHTRGAL